MLDFCLIFLPSVTYPERTKSNTDSGEPGYFKKQAYCYLGTKIPLGVFQKSYLI